MGQVFRERDRSGLLYIAAGNIPFAEEAYIDIAPFGRRRGQP
jgi:hypothetical protein